MVPKTRDITARKRYWHERKQAAPMNTAAHAKWGKDALWIHGEGPFALLAPCGQGLTISLWPSLTDALIARTDIDIAGCGGACDPIFHEIWEFVKGWRRAM